MSCRIEKRFAELRARQRKGLIPFITAGDPLPNASVAIMHALVDYGADLIELGVPYSDPVADGPTIQHSSERAIARGVGIEQILGWVREFRERDVDTPIVLMGYLNPLEIYGYGRFASEARDAGGFRSASWPRSWESARSGGRGGRSRSDPDPPRAGGWASPQGAPRSRCVRAAD